MHSKTLLRMAGILFLAILFASCTLDSTASEDKKELKKVAEYKLNVAEPSGLVLNAEMDALYTVSDNNNHVYKLSLGGQVLSELSYVGTDLEGITFDLRDSTLWLAEEQERVIVQVDLSGNELQRRAIGLNGTGNSGLEGITFDAQHNLYVLNEKNPRLWARLNSNFKVAETKEIPNVEDISGICYDVKRKQFWIVSDQSQKLLLWSDKSGIVKSFDLNFKKAEGVTYNAKKDRLYIVSDSAGMLYVFDVSLN